MSLSLISPMRLPLKLSAIFFLILTATCSYITYSVFIAPPTPMAMFTTAGRPAFANFTVSFVCPEAWQLEEYGSPTGDVEVGLLPSEGILERRAMSFVASHAADYVNAPKPIIPDSAKVHRKEEIELSGRKCFVVEFSRSLPPNNYLRGASWQFVVDGLHVALTGTVTSRPAEVAAETDRRFRAYLAKFEAVALSVMSVGQ